MKWQERFMCGLSLQTKYMVLVLSGKMHDALVHRDQDQPLLHGQAQQVSIRNLLGTIQFTGMKTTGVVRCDRPRVLDIQSRGGKKMETLPLEILDEVLARTVTLFQ